MLLDILNSSENLLSNMTDKRNEGTINMKEINQLNDTNSSLDGFRKEINED